MSLETCRMCAATEDEKVSVGEDIPLCTKHWNSWLIRYALGEEEPPCSAHLIEGQP